MAAVPGPRPDRPFPPPGMTEAPPRQPDEERHASPEPAWEPEPYDPEREETEQEEPLAVP